MKSTARLVGLAALLLLACGGAEGPPVATPAPPASSAPAPVPDPVPVADAGAPKAETPEPKPAPASVTTVKLLEPGAAPRRALRYVFKANTSDRVQMDMKLAMAMVGAREASKKLQMPSVRTVMRVDAKEVSPEGELKYTFDTESVEVLKDQAIDPKMFSELEAQMKRLVGMKGSGRVTSRGVSSDVEVELPASLPPGARGSLDTIRDTVKDMATPFPEEEVGVGAKWEVLTRSSMGGAQNDVKTTFALKKLSADAMTADVDIAMSAPANQPLTLANLPPGATASLASMTGTGKGTVTRPFAKLVGDAKTTVASETLMKVKPAPDAEDVQMGTKVDVVVTLRPAPKAASGAKANMPGAAAPASKKP